MFYSINMKGNTKTNIPTSTSAKESCPDTCPPKEKGYYAKYSFLGNYWKKLSNGEVKNSFNYETFLSKIKALNDGQLWRHNQAGDLKHNNGYIDKQALNSLVEANKGKRGFTYTHHEVLNNLHNSSAISIANDEGFTINLSSNNLEEADILYNLEMAPIVTLLPVGTEKVSYTDNGIRIVKCPSDYDKITCKECKLCAISDRDFIIGFEAHGTAKKSRFTHCY